MHTRPGPSPRAAWVRYWLPRSLNPAAWWAYAIALAAAASLTINPLLTLLLMAVAAVVVAARRGDGPWSRSFRFYLLLGAFIVIMRLFYRVIFGGGDGETILFRLPEVPLPYWVGGFRLLGAVSAESLLYGLYDGLRLACIVVCVGAANSLANPKRLLAQVPGALYEIGAILVVSVTVFAQLADSVLRVRRARALRTGVSAPGRGFVRRYRFVRAIVVPVVTDALDRSLQLASSMDARGYGRTGGGRVADRVRSAVLILAAMILLSIGAYATLSGFMDQLRIGPLALPAGVPFLAAGALCGVLGFRFAGRTVRRTRYRPDGWGVAETLVVACGLTPFVVFSIVWESADAAVLIPTVDEWPVVTPLLLVGFAIALLPAVITPPPALGVGEADRHRAELGGLS
ncbi:CbiQ family ECF transporter T component [Naumannella huperziae]